MKKLLLIVAIFAFVENSFAACQICYWNHYNNMEDCFNSSKSCADWKCPGIDKNGCECYEGRERIIKTVDFVKVVNIDFILRNFEKINGKLDQELKPGEISRILADVESNSITIIIYNEDLIKEGKAKENAILRKVTLN
jgi:hypothetical protein